MERPADQRLRHVSRLSISRSIRTTTLTRRFDTAHRRFQRLASSEKIRTSRASRYAALRPRNVSSAAKHRWRPLQIKARRRSEWCLPSAPPVEKTDARRRRAAQCPRRTKRRPKPMQRGWRTPTATAGRPAVAMRLRRARRRRGTGAYSRHCRDPHPGLRVRPPRPE